MVMVMVIMVVIVSATGSVVVMMVVIVFVVLAAAREGSQLHSLMLMMIQRPERIDSLWDTNVDDIVARGHHQRSSR